MRSCHLGISIYYPQNAILEAGAGAGDTGRYDKCITAPSRADLKGQQQCAARRLKRSSSEKERWIPIYNVHCGVFWGVHAVRYAVKLQTGRP